MSIHYSEGRYIVEILSQALGKTSNGNAQIALKVLVISHEDGEPCTQYERTIYRVITEKTIPYVVEDLRALGYSRDSFRFIDPNDPNHHSFAGQQITAFCSHQEYQGKTNERWSVYTGGGALDVKPLESSEARKLDALFGKALKPLATSERKPPPAAAATSIVDDDVPF